MGASLPPSHSESVIMPPSIYLNEDHPAPPVQHRGVGAPIANAVTVAPIDLAVLRTRKLSSGTLLSGLVEDVKPAGKDGQKVYGENSDT